MNSNTVTIKCASEIVKDENVSIYCHIKSFQLTQISDTDPWLRLVTHAWFNTQSYKP